MREHFDRVNKTNALRVHLCRPLSQRPPQMCVMCSICYDFVHILTLTCQHIQLLYMLSVWVCILLCTFRQLPTSHSLGLPHLAHAHTHRRGRRRQLRWRCLSRVSRTSGARQSFESADKLISFDVCVMYRVHARIHA